MIFAHKCVECPFVCLSDILMWLAGYHCLSETADSFELQAFTVHLQHLTTLATGINLSRKKIEEWKAKDWLANGLDIQVRCNTQKSSKYFKVCVLPPVSHLTKDYTNMIKDCWPAMLDSMWCVNIEQNTLSCRTKWRFHDLDFIKHCWSVKPQCLYPELNILYKYHHLHITTSVKWITTNTIPIKK